MMTKLHKAAGQILFEEVFNLDEISTVDYSGMKLTNVPIEYLREFRYMGGGLSVVSYQPHLTPETFIENFLQSFYMLHITIGYHIYVKERSFRTHQSPFTYLLDHEGIMKVKRKVFSFQDGALERLLLSRPADKAFYLARAYAREHTPYAQFHEKGHRLKRKLHKALTLIAMIMGYNFAHEVLFPQIPIDHDWPKKAMKTMR